MRLTTGIFENTLQKIELSDTNSGILRSQLYSNMAKTIIYYCEREKRECFNEVNSS